MLTIPYECYIGLGANLGNREASLRGALAKINNIHGVKIVSVSSFYETEPWGNVNQPLFLNAAACLKVSMDPFELLADLQRIEHELGRVRHEHWGARTIDLDMLYIPDYSSQEERLRLPHPYMLERAFVIVPLTEIKPDLVIQGKTITEYCQRVQGKDGIKLFKAFNDA